MNGAWNGENFDKAEYSINKNLIFLKMVQGHDIEI